MSVHIHSSHTIKKLEDEILENIEAVVKKGNSLIGDKTSLAIYHYLVAHLNPHMTPSEALDTLRDLIKNYIRRNDPIGSLCISKYKEERCLSTLYKEDPDTLVFSYFNPFTEKTESLSINLNDRSRKNIEKLYLMTNLVSLYRIINYAFGLYYYDSEYPSLLAEAFHRLGLTPYPILSLDNNIITIVIKDKPIILKSYDSDGLKYASMDLILYDDTIQNYDNEFLHLHYFYDHPKDLEYLKIVLENLKQGGNLFKFFNKVIDPLKNPEDYVLMLKYFLSSSRLELPTHPYVYSVFIFNDKELLEPFILYNKELVKKVKYKIEDIILEFETYSISLFDENFYNKISEILSNPIYDPKSVLGVKILLKLNINGETDYTIVKKDPMYVDSLKKLSKKSLKKIAEAIKNDFSPERDAIVVLDNVHPLVIIYPNNDETPVVLAFRTDSTKHLIASFFA